MHKLILIYRSYDSLDTDIVVERLYKHMDKLEKYNMSLVNKFTERV